jgi:hypothetical protein
VPDQSQREIGRQRRSSQRLIPSRPWLVGPGEYAVKKLLASKTEAINHVTQQVTLDNVSL